MKNTVFTLFSGIIQNLIVSVWYHHIPFFSNVETQVVSNGGVCRTALATTGVLKIAYLNMSNPASDIAIMTFKNYIGYRM